jgi:hypothetical protein
MIMILCSALLMSCERSALAGATIGSTGCVIQRVQLITSIMIIKDLKIFAGQGTQLQLQTQGIIWILGQTCSRERDKNAVSGSKKA